MGGEKNMPMQFTWFGRGSGLNSGPAFHTKFHGGFERLTAFDALHINLG